MKKLIFASIVLGTLAAMSQAALPHIPAQLAAYEVSYGLNPAEVAMSGQASGYVSDGVAYLESWTVPGIPAPTAETLPSVEEAEVILAADSAAKDAARQASKPDERKQYENRYFELSSTVLAAAGDPRASETPAPKLGFMELSDLIRTIQATNAMGAVSLTLELLTVDAALKRFDQLWWDDVAVHE